jgi:hypothetical protein
MYREGEKVVHGDTTVSPTPPAAALAASRGPSVAAAGAGGRR